MASWTVEDKQTLGTNGVAILSEGYAIFVLEGFRPKAILRKEMNNSKEYGEKTDIQKEVAIAFEEVAHDKKENSGNCSKEKEGR